MRLFQPAHPRWAAGQIQWEGGFARPRCEFPESDGESSSPNDISSHHNSARVCVRYRKLMNVSRENVCLRTDRYQIFIRIRIEQKIWIWMRSISYIGNQKKSEHQREKILPWWQTLIHYHFHSAPMLASNPSTPWSSISEHFSHRAHFITLAFREGSESERQNSPLFVIDKWWLDQRPLPSGLVTSGSHCAVRLGHSSAWVITRSYRNGVFFFQI